jgi:hypothetical protein
MVQMEGFALAGLGLALAAAGAVKALALGGLDGVVLIGIGALLVYGGIHSLRIKSTF